ncbi:MAG TPA: gluconate 2-dehydrogenase subunit 3 family protein [Bryobacteraceae bacterium]|nr:gluconate 2-dehydrogenase subunit 3 family protein [Bryobacteraceae bacterium]HOQ46984.1 gluconate 2-dehydrogenase subunit 3 family protein [Bryobacteraceae bacterium]HPQ17290.1 gluconate 2-dehydrogenase subunit 3 family protein [Bryobacteraceae bacterium]HPU73089.1 gluconate 2-dehydrogenase subunit 3 family protein [Bryobacteraceae bacterium]
MSTGRKTVKRRKFLKIGLAASASGLLISCGRTGGGPHWRFFTEEEARTVDAICEQIIPADDFPGASQAGVVNFIDLQLTRHYKKHRAAYRKGVANVEAVSRETFGKRFTELEPQQQIEVLTTIEEKDPAFFALIRNHTMQGYYGDPRHGGNREWVSWKMLALASPPVRGRARLDKESRVS